MVGMGNRTLQLRLDDERRARYEKSAKALGIGLTAWVRKVADEACGYGTVRVGHKKRAVVVIEVEKAVAAVVKAEHGINQFHKLGCACRLCKEERG
jgi:hypothetical protein